jgi:hypothetical protein
MKNIENKIRYWEEKAPRCPPIFDKLYLRENLWRTFMEEPLNDRE